MSETRILLNFVKKLNEEINKSMDRAEELEFVSIAKYVNEVNHARAISTVRMCLLEALNDDYEVNKDV
jgi:hypothetical protein